MSEKGLSPIAATLMLISLTIASVGIVGVFLSQAPLPSPAPDADFSVSGIEAKPSTNEVKINVLHEGGGAVPKDDLKIVMEGWSQEAGYQVAETGTVWISGDSTFEAGEMVIFKLLGGPSIFPQGAEVDVRLVHEPSGQILLSVSGLTVGGVAVPDFSILVSPTSGTITQGDSDTAAVSVVAYKGYDNTVDLTASGQPADVSVSFNPASGTPSFGSTMTISVGSGAALGTYDITITGTGSDGKVRTCTYTLTVTEPPQPDFSITVNPESATILQGDNDTAAISVTSIEGYDNTVDLTASGQPADVSVSFNPASGTPSFGSTMTVVVGASAPTGAYPLSITGTGSDGTTHSCTYTLTIEAPNPDFTISVDPSSGTIPQGGSDTATVRLTSLEGYNETVDLSSSGEPADVTVTFNPSSGTPSFESTMTITVGASVPEDNYVITITGTGATKTHNTTYTLEVTMGGTSPDFSISVNPTSGSVPKGSENTATVTVTSIGGYDKLVRLGVETLPTGVSVSYEPNKGNPTYASTMTITADSTASEGVYDITIAGTGARAGTHKCTYTLTVAGPAPDFSILVSPTSGTIAQGSSDTATVTVSSIGGYSGTVNISSSGAPSGTTVSFSPSSGTPDFTSTMTINVGASSPTGTYEITITGDDGTTQHSSTYTLTVETPYPDFGISVSPDSGTVPKGFSDTATVTVTSYSGYSETVTLSASGQPADVSVGFDPSSATPSFNSTMAISVGSGASTGTYTITITGTGADGTTHSTTYTLTITVGRCYVGVWEKKDGVEGQDDITLIEDFETTAMNGKKVGMVMWFMGYSTWDWTQTFPTTACQNVLDHGSIPHITLEPWLTLDETINGEADPYLQDWASDAAAWGGPLFLRWGHEFNGEWSYWSVAQNGEDPEKYIQAWQHVHDLFVAEGATNVKWIWAPSDMTVPDEPWNDPELAYPGDAYVDWIGISGYNRDNTWWRTFSEIFAGPVTTFSSYSKPIMAAEMACSEEAGDKDVWINGMYDSLVNDPTFEPMQAFVWFDEDKEEPEGFKRWRVDSSPESLAAFQTMTADDYFIDGSAGLWDL